MYTGHRGPSTIHSGVETEREKKVESEGENKYIRKVDMKEKTLNKTMKLYEELNILVIFINLYRLFKQISFHQLSHYYLKLTEVIIPLCYIKDSLDDTWLIT